MSSIPDVRRAREEDGGAIAAVFRGAVTRTAAVDYTSAQVKAWAHVEDVSVWIRRRMESNTWVALMGQRVVGFTDLDLENGHIGMLFVHPDVSRRGVGGLLLRRNIAEAQAAGLSTITVDASLTARTVFERNGFSVVASQRVFRNGVALTNFRMCCQLLLAAPSWDSVQHAC